MTNITDAIAAKSRWLLDLGRRADSNGKLSAAAMQEAAAAAGTRDEPEPEQPSSPPGDGGARTHRPLLSADPRRGLLSDAALAERADDPAEAQRLKGEALAVGKQYPDLYPDG